MLEIEEVLPEAQKIYFQAGNNDSIIFRHDTDCIVSLGNTDVPKGKKVVLNFDDKLYIVFEDNVSEIEVRYKRARKLVHAL